MPVFNVLPHSSKSTLPCLLRKIMMIPLNISPFSVNIWHNVKLVTRGCQGNTGGKKRFFLLPSLTSLLQYAISVIPGLQHITSPALGSWNVLRTACNVLYIAASPGTFSDRFPAKFTGATSSSSDEATTLSTHSGFQFGGQGILFSKHCPRGSSFSWQLRFWYSLGALFISYYSISCNFIPCYSY